MTSTTPPDPGDHAHAGPYLEEVARHLRDLLAPVKAGAKAHNSAATEESYGERGVPFLRSDLTAHHETWKAMGDIIEQVKLTADALHQQIPIQAKTSAQASAAWAALDTAEAEAARTREMPPF